MTGPSDQPGLAKQRQAALDAILNSTSSRKLVVAGPGTGNTFTFRLVLRQAGGGVALTFIRALVCDLRIALKDDAQIVNTLHGFAKHLLHAHPYGVTADFLYVPALPLILARDLTILGVEAITRPQIDSAFQRLDDADGLITESIRLGEYYNAVGHNDVVYRVLSHFAASAAEIPTYPVIVVDGGVGKPTRRDKEPSGFSSGMNTHKMLRGVCGPTRFRSGRGGRPRSGPSLTSSTRRACERDGTSACRPLTPPSSASCHLDGHQSAAANGV